MKAIAMILESYPENMHYEPMAYVRILDVGASEPKDTCIGGDVQDYLDRWHDGAHIVDASTFMDEWMLRRVWQALQDVPSYIEAQAQAFAAEPEPVPLAERGVLNGQQGFSLLR